jgi:hypothetical protein
MRKFFVFTIVITAYFLFQRSWLTYVSLAITIILGYEQALRAKSRKFNLATSVGHLRSRLTALPYSEESFNAQFITCFPRNKFEARRIFFLDKSNFTSPLLNFVGGLRKTSFVEPDQTYKNSIYLFGGSTIDCLEVPDDYTIASRLQREVNSISSGFEVINCGVAGATLRANYDHFQNLEVSKGDICLFYFGINEINFGSKYSEKFFVFKFPLSLIPKINRLRNRKIFSLISLTRLVHLASTFDRDNVIFTEKISEISEILNSIEYYCVEREITFVAVLQPFINTRSPISRHDRPTFSHYWPKSHFKAHTLFLERIADEFRDRNFFIDSRTVFDNVDLDVYTEWCHTNYLGNQLIAKNFYQIILDRTLQY